MTASIRCAVCQSEIESGDRFCSQCGKTTGQISWSLSGSREPVSGPILLRPGHPLFLIARNTGQNTVRVEVDKSRARGLALQNVSQARVPAQQSYAFELHTVTGEPIAGQLLLRSQDGPRSAWWQRADWRRESLSLSGKVRVTEDRWVFGSPTLLFPPGVTGQSIRIWNVSDQERVFDCPVPIGYRVLNFGNPIETQPPAVGPNATMELRVQAQSSRLIGNADADWLPEPQREPIPLIRMGSPAAEIGPDVVVAIDFGTRNTGIRVRWRRTLFPSRPAGTIDAVGDRGGDMRFPTEMVLNLRHDGLSWGADAATRIERNLLSPDEVAIDNLKTYLRSDQNHYCRLRADWTNEELLGRYFEQIFYRLDAYFRAVDAGSLVTRENLNVRYVLTRPVMDANTGDEIGKAYEQALSSAMARNGVDSSRITFLYEPVAAAIGIARRHQQELMQADGAAIAIIDAGGGTTDVALARVRLRDGGVTLEIAGSYALTLDASNPALPALDYFRQKDRTELGGNTLDCALTCRLAIDADDLLETDGRPIPQKLTLGSAPAGNDGLDAADQRQFLSICRHMKERFVYGTKIYLNRGTDQERAEGEVVPFPTRPEYAGIYLEHGAYEACLLSPILQPIMGLLQEQISLAAATAGVDGMRVTQVQRVFYVGGTNLDARVREQFGRAFPNSPRDLDGAERIEERLNAVVEGAVWAEEQLFAPSPLTLTLVLDDRRSPLIEQRGALRPDAIAPKRFETCSVASGEELKATLVASGLGLPEPITVARAFFVNTADEAVDVTLSVKVCRERGAVATLLVGAREYEQWQFALTGAAR